MAWIKKRKGNEQNLMLCVPEISHSDFVIRNGMVCLIFHHNKPVERLLQRIFRKSSVTDLQLDEIGTKVWLSMDGKNTIYDIAKLLSLQFNQELQDVCKRLALYVTYMISKGWIAIKKSNP